MSRRRRRQDRSRRGSRDRRSRGREGRYRHRDRRSRQDSSRSRRDVSTRRPDVMEVFVFDGKKNTYLKIEIKIRSSWKRKELRRRIRSSIASTRLIDGPPPNMFGVLHLYIYHSLMKRNVSNKWVILNLILLFINYRTQSPVSGGRVSQFGPSLSPTMRLTGTTLTKMTPWSATTHAASACRAMSATRKNASLARES